MDNAREILAERKSEQINPFGFTQKSLTSGEQNQVTPFDGFLLEDCLRLGSANNSIDELKTKMAPRLNKENGLYEVTVGDNGSEYYYFATMFNRMTDATYSKKVYRSLGLLNEIIRGIKRDYTDTIEGTISREQIRDIDDEHIK